MDAKTEALQQIARMRTLPDDVVNTFTLVAAKQIAERALASPEGKAPEPPACLKWVRRPGLAGFKAHSICGLYEVGDVGGAMALLRTIDADGQWTDIAIARCSSIPKAKAAAQADYERRVLSCLASPLVSRTAELEEEIKRLRMKATKAVDAVMRQAWNKGPGSVHGADVTLMMALTCIDDIRVGVPAAIRALATKRSEADV